MDKPVKIALIIVVLVFIVIPLLAFLVVGGLFAGLSRSLRRTGPDDVGGCCCRNDGTGWALATDGGCPAGQTHTTKHCSAPACAQTIAGLKP